MKRVGGEKNFVCYIVWVADCRRNFSNPNMTSNYKELNSGRKTWALSYYYLYYTSDVNIHLILQSDEMPGVIAVLNCFERVKWCGVQLNDPQFICLSYAALQI